MVFLHHTYKHNFNHSKGVYKMTDNEKLDLILNKVQGIEADIHGMKSEMQDMKTDIQGIKQRIDKLALGQSEIQKEIYILNRKISDTYNVALDALGTSAENRTWLEHGTLA